MSDFGEVMFRTAFPGVSWPEAAVLGGTSNGLFHVDEGAIDLAIPAGFSGGIAVRRSQREREFGEPRGARGADLRGWGRNVHTYINRENAGSINVLVGSVPMSDFGFVWARGRVEGASLGRRGWIRGSGLACCGVFNIGDSGLACCGGLCPTDG